MKRTEFFSALQEIMQTETEFTEETRLEGMEEFDSLAVMGLVALANQKLGKHIAVADFQKAKTVADLMQILGRENFD